MPSITVFAFLSTVALQVGATQPGDPPAKPVSNLEMTEMFELDQSMRQDDLSKDAVWVKIMAKDKDHRIRTRALLDKGSLTTGEDFYHAAFIFQHGGKPEDYLLAHIMATSAMKLGYHGAEWIAAATLDRYLQSIGQPQIFGTQLRGKPDGNGKMIWTVDPVDAALLTDDVRALHGVGKIEDKVREADDLNNGDDAPSAQR